MHRHVAAVRGNESSVPRGSLVSADPTGCCWDVVRLWDVSEAVDVSVQYQALERVNEDRPSLLRSDGSRTGID